MKAISRVSKKWVCLKIKYECFGQCADLITVKPLQNSYLGDRRKWPLYRGGRFGGGSGVIWPFFFLASTLL